MRKIVIAILILAGCTAQAQWIQNRTAFIARDSVSSPVYHKGTDTIPSTTEVASQISDSISGIGGGITPAYGSLWFFNGSAATLAYTTSWDTISCYDTARAGLELYTDIDTTTNEISASSGGAGVYDVEYSVSINLNNQRIETAIFKNDSYLLKESVAIVGDGGSSDHMATGKVRVYLSEGDKVEFKYRFTGGSGAAGYDAFRLSIDKVND